MARQCISRIRSGFTARGAAKGATGCARLQLPMRSGSRMVRQTLARDRTSPTWQFMAHGCFGHRTAGRFRRARRSPTVDDTGSHWQRRPSGSRTMHRLLLGPHKSQVEPITVENPARGGSAAIATVVFLSGIFLFAGLPPKENNNNGMTCTRISPRRSHVRNASGIGIGPLAGEPCGRPIGILMPFTRLCRGTTAMQR